MVCYAINTDAITDNFSKQPKVCLRTKGWFCSKYKCTYRTNITSFILTVVGYVINAGPIINICFSNFVVSILVYATIVLQLSITSWLCGEYRCNPK